MDTFYSPNVWEKDHNQFGLSHHSEVFKCHCLKWQYEGHSDFIGIIFFLQTYIWQNMLIFHAGYLYNVGCMMQVLVVTAAHISKTQNYIWMCCKFNGKMSFYSINFVCKEGGKGMKFITDTEWEPCVSCSSLFDGTNNYLCAECDSKNKG